MGIELNLAARIKNLKFGKPFYVKTEADRVKVCKIAKNLKDAGAIEFTVVTAKEGERFKVAAI